MPVNKGFGSNPGSTITGRNPNPSQTNTPGVQMNATQPPSNSAQLAVKPLNQPMTTQRTNNHAPAVSKSQGQNVAIPQVQMNSIKTKPKITEVETDYNKFKVGSSQFWYNAWQHFVDKETIKDPQLEKIILEISLPQDNEIEPIAAEQMYASMIGLGQKPGAFFETIVGLLPFTEILFKNPDNAFSFEIVADEKEVRFWVVVPKQWRDFVERQIHGAYPEAEIEPVSGDNFLGENGPIKMNELTMKGKIFYPIRVIEDFETDPLSSMTSTVSKLGAGERAIIQFLLQPADDSWRKAGSRFVQLAQSPPKSEHEHKPQVDSSVIEAISKEITKPGFRTVIRVMVQSPDSFSGETILNNIVGGFDQFSLPHLTRFEKSKKNSDKNQIIEFITRSFPRWGNYHVFNTLELGTLYHFPNKEIKTPRIKWLRVRKSPPPTNMPTDGLYLGKSEYRNSLVEVKITQDDRRRHMYIIGQTGSGKSEFLKHMVYQDIVNGNGLAFLDPHGEAVEDILEMVPKERAEDVIYFNPSDSERPMGLNILDAKTEEQKHMVVNGFIGLLYKLYDPNHTGMVGPQLERAVRNVMLTAMVEEGNTMVEVLRLLTNPKYAEKKIPLIKDPLVKTYWTEQMAQTNEFHRSETLGYFVSKFDRFVTEKMMRNIIGQPKSAFNFREIMDQKKILLVNLSKGKIGEENSNFLGLLLIPRILAAAMSRADMAKEDRKDFYLYVDEFQNFATPDFVQILAEARKYRLSLVVANQFIAQIQEDIRNAVFGNVGTMMSFRIGADDGEYMEKQFDPVFKQLDLINQSIGQCVTRLLIDGQPSRPFSFKTDWQAMQQIPKNPKIAQVIKEISRLKYGRDQKIVEREISTRAGFE